MIFTRRAIIGAGLLLALWVLLVPAEAGSCYIGGPGEAAADAVGSAKAPLAAREPIEPAAVKMPVSARLPWGMDGAAVPAAFPDVVTMTNPAAATGASALETGLDFVTGWAVVSEWLDWQRCLGGSSSDYVNSIQATPDGGYIMAGYTYSNDGDVSGNHGSYDVWVVKLDQSGNLQWQKCLGGSSYDYVNSIQATPDGGYIMAGQTDSNDGDVSGNHGSYDVWAVKLDQSGNLQWQKCLGGSSYDYVNNIQATPDGGYIMAGQTDSYDGDVSGYHYNSDVWVVKLDQSGNLEWQKCLGGNGTEYANSIQATPDGGYIMAGQTDSNGGDVSGNHGYNDVWVVKLDQSGNLQWQRCLGGSSDDYSNSIQETSDGGYIMAGFTISNDGDVSGNHGYYDVWVIKLDQSGNLQWQRCLGGTSADYVNINSIQATPDGGYIMAGQTNSNDGDVSGNHGYNDVWVVKISPIEWQASYGGSGGDYIWDAAQAGDGGYVFVGETDSQAGDVSGNHGRQDAWVAKVDSGGALLWQSCIGGSGDDYGRSIAQVDGGYFLAGSTTSTDGEMEGNHGGTDAWVAFLDDDLTLQWVRCYGGTGEDYATTVGITYDDNNDIGYIMVGYTSSNDGDVSGNHGGYDLWAMRLDQLGNILWQKCFGGSDDDYGSGLMPTEGDNLFLKGYTRSNDGDVSGNHGGFDFWFLYTNSTGQIRAQTCAGGSSDDYGYGINWGLFMGRTLSNDGDVIGNHGGYDAWTMVCNGIRYDGNTTEVIFDDMLCLGGSEWDEGRDIDYSYISDSTLLVGSSQSNDGDAIGNHGDWDMWAVSLSSDHMDGWDYAWSRCFGGSGSDYGSAVVPCSDGGWLLAGYTGSNNGDLSNLARQGDYDAWVVKLRPQATGVSQPAC